MITFLTFDKKGIVWTIYKFQTVMFLDYAVKYN